MKRYLHYILLIILALASACSKKVVEPNEVETVFDFHDVPNLSDTMYLNEVMAFGLSIQAKEINSLKIYQSVDGGTDSLVDSYNSIPTPAQRYQLTYNYTVAEKDPHTIKLSFILEVVESGNTSQKQLFAEFKTGLSKEGLPVLDIISMNANSLVNTQGTYFASPGDTLYFNYEVNAPHGIDRMEFYSQEAGAAWTLDGNDLSNQGKTSVIGEYKYVIPNIQYGQKATVKLEVFDTDRLFSYQIIPITVVPKVTKTTGLTLFAQNTPEKRFYSVIRDSVYTESDIQAAQSTDPKLLNEIDFNFVELGPSVQDTPFLLSPDQLSNEGISASYTLTTQASFIAFTGSFDTADWSEIKTQASNATAKKLQIAKSGVYAFKTNTGNYGLIQVDNWVGSTSGTGSITVSMKTFN